MLAGFAVAALLLVLPVAMAANDRLDRPARTTVLASDSLLLDVIQSSGRFYAVGERGHILFAEDETLAWRQAEVPVSVTLTAVSFVNESLGWAVGHDGVILHSTDGGHHWQRQLDGRELNRLNQRHYSSLLDQLSDPDSEQAERLRFLLEEAEAATQDGPVQPFLDVLFITPQHGWAVGAYGLALETQDGGRTWLPRMERMDNPDAFHLNTLLLDSAGRLYLAGEAGLLLRSDDRGLNWQRLDFPYDGSLYSLAEQPERGELYAFGLRGRGFVSDNQGLSWQELETQTRSTLNAAQSLPDGRLLVVGNAGTLTLGEGDQYRSQVRAGRQHLSALAISRDQLILVGQGGIKTLPLQAFMGEQR